MYKNLVKRVKEDSEKRIAESKFFIKNGYCENWASDNQNFGDYGIKRYATDYRWNQYQKGIISRDQAVVYAIKRMEKQLEKYEHKQFAKLEMVENAEVLNSFSVNVYYTKSRTWGYNPQVTVYADIKTCGTASGCGYDKESSAVADAFNANPSILKILYDLKEKALQEGKSDFSKTACTGVDNREIIGYGSGYSVLPYFEGGVGVGCFWSIFEKAGYAVKCFYGKKENNYQIEK